MTVQKPINPTYNGKAGPAKTDRAQTIYLYVAGQKFGQISPTSRIQENVKSSYLEVGLRMNWKFNQEAY